MHHARLPIGMAGLRRPGETPLLRLPIGLGLSAHPTARRKHCVSATGSAAACSCVPSAIASHVPQPKASAAGVRCGLRGGRLSGQPWLSHCWRAGTATE